MIRFTKILFYWIFCASLLLSQVMAGDLVLWYQQPAKNTMNEGLPIGSGRLGALVMGEPTRERLILNEDSLWTGDKHPNGDYNTLGAYQLLGNLYINFPDHANVSDYRRDLNLSNAVATVSYKSGDVQYRREFLASAAAQCVVGQLTASKPGALNGSFEIEDGHKGQVEVSGGSFMVSGTVANGELYFWKVQVINKGGSLAISDKKIEFKNCDSLTILAAAGTDYVMDVTKAYHGQNPQGQVVERVDDASSLSFDDLKAAHIKDYQSLFNRVTLDLGASSAEQKALPTDKRKLLVAQTPDPELTVLLFQYGRYLMIGSSRPGGLPANLQGVWNDRNNPPWNSDYHTNINIQMNYWPVEVANLSECHLPLFDLIISQLPDWRDLSYASNDLKNANGELPKRGWAVRTAHNINGGMGWKWDKTANAWYCQHFWEHYLFTQDREFLQKVAYPVMKEVCEFWQDQLKTLPDGRLVVPNGWSPEHGPAEDGVAYNQQIVWDLFDNYVSACDVLGIDKEYRDKIAGMRDKLVVTRVGSWGQLLEWMSEKKGGDLDTPQDHHRHTSHLFAVFPGHQFTLEQTPDLMKAAKVSLDARGIAENSDVREWSLAWRAALNARLRDGEGAYLFVKTMFAARHTCPNMFGLHPPMQIDGNFGMCAAIAEMLLQSRKPAADGVWEIDLLPALPKEWKDGTVSGLRARGGFEISFAWQEGCLTSVEIKNIAGNKCRVRCGDKLVDVEVAKGEIKKLELKSP